MKALACVGDRRPIARPVPCPIARHCKAYAPPYLS